MGRSSWGWPVSTTRKPALSASATPCEYARPGLAAKAKRGAGAIPDTFRLKASALESLASNSSSERYRALGGSAGVRSASAKSAKVRQASSTCSMSALARSATPSSTTSWSLDRTSNSVRIDG